MTKYRISKYDSYTQCGFCAEERGWHTLWCWVLVKNYYGNVIIGTENHIKHLIKCWTDKPKVTPLTKRKKK